MKKFLLVALSVMMIFALTGCKEDEPGPGPGPTTTKYTVTFDSNHTDAAGTFTDANPKTIQVESGKAIGAANMPEMPVRDAEFIFTKWTVATEASSAEFVGTETITANITVYAQWKAGYTVTFDPNREGTGHHPLHVSVDPDASDKVSNEDFPEWDYETAEGRFIVMAWYTTKECTAGTEFDHNTVVIKSITVYAKWDQGFYVDFHYNYANDGTEPDMERMAVSQNNPKLTSAQIATVNAKTTRAYYEFKFWSYSADSHWEYDDGDAVDIADEEFADDNQFYAIWKFVGGTAAVVDGVLIHNRPLMEIEGDAEMLANGSIKIDGTKQGTIKYKFPAGAEGYDFYVIGRTMIAGDMSNTNMYKYDGGTNMGAVGIGTNQNNYPWLSNADWQRRAVANALDLVNDPAANGFAIKSQATTSGGTVRFDAIAFYKAPRYTVSFDLNFEGKDLDGNDLEDIDDVENVWGACDHMAVGSFTTLSGPGVGSSNWPGFAAGQEVKDKDNTSWWFLGWYDGEDEKGYSSAITGDVTFVAKWTDVPPPMFQYVTVTANAHQAAFEFPISTEGKDQTWGDIKQITYEVFVESTYIATNIREHVVYIGPGGFAFTDSSIGKYQVGWGARRLNNYTAGANFNTHITGAVAGQWISITKEWTKNGEFAGDWAALETNKDDIILGVGFATGAAGITFSYYIKDVALIMADGTRVDALEKDDTTIKNFWAPGGMGDVISIWKPLP